MSPISGQTVPLPSGAPSFVAGSVLPIRRAEELLATLPGVLSAKIIASESGAVDEIHLLTTSEYTPKQTVRNVESALIAHLGMRVDHRKISVAMSTEPTPAPAAPDIRETIEASRSTAAVPDSIMRRRIYFEDVEVRRSRSRGVTCRVTLRKDGESYSADADGMDGSRSRVDLAARAALKALSQAEGSNERTLAIDGVTFVTSFGKEFVFVGLSVRAGRESSLLTGSCEVRESPETAGVLATLDATNRWMAHER